MKTQIKTNSRTVWILITAVVAILSFYAFMVVGITTAKAQGGSCAITIGPFCLTDVVNELRGITEVEEPEPVLGAVSGPDSYFVYVGSNDVRRYSQRLVMRQGTTTLCSFISPLGASSTPVFASAFFTLASTSATDVAFYKSVSDPTATTTIISPIISIGADVGGTAIASTTQSDRGEQASYIFASGQRLNVSLAGADEGEVDGEDGGFSRIVPVGQCQVIWQEV